MPMKIEPLEALADIGNKSTIVGATSGALGAFFSSNIVGLLGVVVALLGVWVNYHFKRQARQARLEIAELEKEEIRTRIRLMQGTGAIVVPVPKEMSSEISTDFGALEETRLQ